MKNKLMLGLWRYIIKVPPFLWKKGIEQGRRKFVKEHGSLSEESRLIHHFAVRELPRNSKPLSPELISDGLGIPIDRINANLDYLEKRMTFLYRNKDGDVLWAYPVTVDKTPHRITFNTGEQLYAAWAVDAFATPFVQGNLRNEYLSVQVETECAHCNSPMEIEIDSNLSYKTNDKRCEPIIFVPTIDPSSIKDDSIIDSFWTECVFFWSEEHAKEYRKTKHRIRGAYMKAEQMVYVTRIIQSAIFGFNSEKQRA